MLVESYEEGRLLWDAKGWIVEAVATEIADDPTLADFKLAPSTLHRYSGTKRRLPPPIAAKIEGLKTHPKREHLTEIVEAGLRVVRGQPQPSLRDPHELALALLAHFPTDDFALKLAEAVASRAGGKASPLTKLGRRLARLVAKRLGGAASGGKLDTLQVTLNHTDAMVGVIDAKLDSGEARRRKDKRDVLATVCGTGFIVVACMFVLQCQHAPTTASPASVTAAPAPAVQQLTMNMVWPGMPDFAKQPDAAGVMGSNGLGSVAGAMGRRQRPMIPDKAFEWQKLPPCNSQADEEAINGGCWYRGHSPAPCASPSFEHAGNCYRAIQRDAAPAPQSEAREPGQ